MKNISLLPVVPQITEHPVFIRETSKSFNCSVPYLSLKIAKVPLFFNLFLFSTRDMQFHKRLIFNPSLSAL